jgi:hypothetical protein
LFLVINEIEFMKEHLKKLRAKPEHEKTKILYISMFVVMFIVVALWAGMLKMRLGEAKTNVTKSSVFQPFAMIKESFKKAYDEASGGVANIKNSVSDVSKDQINNK